MTPGLQWDSGNESSNCVAFIRSAGNESCHETTTATAEATAEATSSSTTTTKSKIFFV